MHTQLEVELVRAAQNGDAQAQEELVTMHLPLVYNVIGRALNGRPDTDDLVQDTVLRAMVGFSALPSAGSFRSWVVAIAMNRVRAYRQDHHTHREGCEGTGLEAARELDDPSADFVALTVTHLKLSGQHLETAEASRWLEGEDQDLLSLWWLECSGELTRAEVAQAVELSAQHTAVRVQRMKAHLESARVVVQVLQATTPCPELYETLRTWNGERSSLWRRQISRHAESCRRCSELQRGMSPPEGLLAGLALVPPSAALTAATRELTTQVVASLPLHSTGSAVASSRGPRSDRLQTRRRQFRRRAAVAGVVVALAASGVALYVFLHPGGSASSGNHISDAELPVVSPSPAVSRTPSPPVSRSASAKPSVSRSSISAPRPSAPTPKAPPSTQQPAVPAPAPESAPDNGGASGEEGQVIALVNKERTAAGCGPVTSSAQLAGAAVNHSNDMAERGFFDHVSPDGTDPGDRITAAGYKWSTYGENIARGQQTAAEVMDGWMNSPGHRANILNCSFKEIGIGIHDGAGGPWWTQAFGAR
ncbi:sigma-70 family RNA polymerase sigma factor [Streptomyces sp. NBC_01017]|uniref:sigma-70 family RNA polymerase sigma factor n=1 Tax=Streptomyces sp. NBC_01017 TaxID=2903721 RepID=UPI0038666C04|nr:sigma-70 family RNA polymerase sigma factor [Streptomyces sp. NBC_01017]WSV35946.1 sigma-70 family RNA polymerase sigma factor [Streptomyces sp. NBC_01017]